MTRPRPWALALAAGLAAAGGPAAAQPAFSWNGADAPWTAATSWTPAGVPTAADVALFQNFTTFGTTSLPSLSADGAAGSVLFDYHGVFVDTAAAEFRGNGRTLTVGTGGARPSARSGPPAASPGPSSTTCGSPWWRSTPRPRRPGTRPRPGCSSTGPAGSCPAG